MNLARAVPHLGTKYPRGNCYKGKPISQDNAVKLKKHNDKGGRVPGLLYDSSMPGFNLSEWNIVIPKSVSECRLLLQPPAGDSGPGKIVHMHRGGAPKDLKKIHHTCSLIMDYHGDVCSGGSWDGMGSMCPAGDHLHLGERKQCAINIKKGQDSSSIRNKIQSHLDSSGMILHDQFADKDVGFHEMLQLQHELWPKRKCHRGPACFNGSKNLGNPEHTDSNDHGRSYAAWVTKSPPHADTAWFLFPQWGVAIELCNGTFISWDGASCAHCTSVPKVAEDSPIFSLFTALPRNLVNALSRQKSGQDQVVDRMARGNTSDEAPAQSLLLSMKIGMKVSLKVCPKSDIPLSRTKRRKISKESMRFQRCRVKSINAEAGTVVLEEMGKNKWNLDIGKNDIWNDVSIA